MSVNNAYRNMYAMGTRFDILMTGVDIDQADAVFKNIRNEVERLESILSIYRDDSVFSNLNRQASAMPVRVDNEVFNLLHDLLRYHELTLGYFDITLGTGKNNAVVEDSDVGNKPVILDRETMSVSFGSPGVKVDSGAFGKGLALKYVKKILLQSGIYNAFISFGESSVLALGHHPLGDHWKVGIKDLFRPDENAYVFEVKDGSVSTSGNSPNNAVKYPEGHIVDPVTGKTIRGYQLMCAAGPDPVDAEVLSTALILADREEQTRILGNFSGYQVVKIDYPDKSDRPTLQEL